MANDIATYGVGLNFTKAMNGLKKLKKEIKSLNDMQVKMNTTRRRMGSMISGRGGGKKSSSAADTKLAQQLRSEERKHQEALGSVMNRQMNKQRRAEKQRIIALNKAKKSLEESAFMTKRQLTAEEKIVKAKIKAAVLDAKSADQVRRIVRNEKTSLRLMQKRSFLLQRMESSSKNFAGNMVSAFAVAATGTAITRTGQDFEAVANTMLAVSKDSEEAGDNLKYVREEAYRLGLGLKESAKGFAKMAAARGDMSLEDTKAAFTGISEMGTLLGLSAEEGSRSINALMQMMSKGVISSEELKLQMGKTLLI